MDLAIKKNPSIEGFEDLNDFQSMLNLSYSYNDPFNNLLDESANASLVLMADINPKFDTPTGAPNPAFGIKPNPGDNANIYEKKFKGDWTANSELTGHVSGNSRNHKHWQQQVLFADGHVKQQRTPLASSAQDNIYTYWSGDPSSDDIHKAIGRWDTISKQFKSSGGAQDKKDSYLGN